MSNGLEIKIDEWPQQEDNEAILLTNESNIEEVFEHLAQSLQQDVMCVTPDLPETKPEKEIPTTFESQKAKKVLLMD